MPKRAIFVRACAVEIHMDKTRMDKTRVGISQELFFVEIYRTILHLLSVHGTLCEPVQSKRTWTFHKSHFCVEVLRVQSFSPKFAKSFEGDNEPFCPQMLKGHL